MDKLEQVLFACITFVLHKTVRLDINCHVYATCLLFLYTSLLTQTLTCRFTQKPKYIKEGHLWRGEQTISHSGEEFALPYPSGHYVVRACDIYNNSAGDN